MNERKVSLIAILSTDLPKFQLHRKYYARTATGAVNSTIVQINK